MNGRVAKMLRRLGKSNKKGKKEWNSFNWGEKSYLIFDYKTRSENVRKLHTERKKNAKISSSKAA